MFLKIFLLSITLLWWCSLVGIADPSESGAMAPTVFIEVILFCGIFFQLVVNFLLACTPPVQNGNASGRKYTQVAVSGSRSIPLLMFTVE